jgi:3-oxoacyl-[acyl-carrier protein] reductase
MKSVPPEKIQRIVDAMPIKRLGTFADISNVIDFFIREESDYITGQVIYLGGVQ